MKEGLIRERFEEIQRISLGVFDVSGIEGRRLSFRVDSNSSVGRQNVRRRRGRGSGSRGSTEEGCRLGLMLSDPPAYLS